MIQIHDRLGMLSLTPVHECRVSPDSIELAAMEFDKIAVLPEASRGTSLSVTTHPPPRCTMVQLESASIRTARDCAVPDCCRFGR